MRRAAPILVALGALMSAEPAEAAVVDGDQPAIVITLGLGSLGAVTTSIAALVYAVRGRSFHTPWVVVSMFSCAITGAFATTLMVDTAREGFGTARAIGLLVYLGLTAWPGYFTVRSALSPGPPGSPFDYEVGYEEAAAWRRPARDPFATRARFTGGFVLPAYATRF